MATFFVVVKRGRCRPDAGGACPVLWPLARRLAASRGPFWIWLHTGSICAGFSRGEAHDLVAHGVIGAPAASRKVRGWICSDVHDVGEGAVARGGDVDLEVAEHDDAAVERQRSAAVGDAASVVDEEAQVAEVGHLPGDNPLT